MGLQKKSHSVDDNIDFILFNGGSVTTLTWVHNQLSQWATKWPSLKRNSKLSN
jgi:hypothetical protein